MNFKCYFLIIIILICFGCAKNLEKDIDTDNIDSVVIKMDKVEVLEQMYLNEINKIKGIENSRLLESNLSNTKEIYENHIYNEDLYKYHDNDGVIRDIHFTKDLPMFLKSIVCDIDKDGIKEILVFKKDWMVYKDYVDRFLQLCNNREYFITLDIYKYSRGKFNKIQSKKLENIHGDFYGGCDEIFRIGYKFNENDNIVIYVEWRRENTSLTHAIAVKINKFEYIENDFIEKGTAEGFFMQEIDYKMQNKNILDDMLIQEFEKQVHEMGIEFETYNYFDKNDSFLEKDNNFNNILTIKVVEPSNKNELYNYGEEISICH